MILQLNNGQDACKKKLHDLEAERVLKDVQNAETEKLVKQVKSLQDDLNANEAKFNALLCRGDQLKKRNITLTKQVSDFEQIVIVERSNFRKQRDELESQLSSLEKQVTDSKLVKPDSAICLLK